MPEDRAEAFEATAREYSPRLMALARLTLGSPEEAEDVVQDSLVKAWERWDDPDVREHAAAWLYRVVRNACIDRLRARDRVAPLTVDAPAPDPVETSPAGSWTMESVLAAVRRLEEPYRGILLLRFSQKLQYEEIAAITGVPLGTVKSQLSRGVRLLRAALVPGRTP